MTWSVPWCAGATITFVCSDSERVLTMCRSIGSFLGKVKTDESREQALLREIREEMEWEIYVGRQIGQVEQEYPDFTITLTAFDCMARDFDFKLLAHIDCRWLPREQLTTLEWTEADRLLIQQLT